MFACICLGAWGTVKKKVLNRDQDEVNCLGVRQREQGRGNVKNGVVENKDVDGTWKRGENSVYIR